LAVNVSTDLDSRNCKCWGAESTIAAVQGALCGSIAMTTRARQINPFWVFPLAFDICVDDGWPYQLSASQASFSATPPAGPIRDARRSRANPNR